MSPSPPPVSRTFLPRPGTSQQKGAPRSPSLAASNALSASGNSPLLDISSKWRLSFCVWPLSLSVTFPRFPHAVDGQCCSPCVARSCSVAWTCHVLLTQAHPPTGPSASAGDGVATEHVQASVWISVFSSSERVPGGRNCGAPSQPCVAFRGAPKRFPTTGTPFRVPCLCLLPTATAPVSQLCFRPCGVSGPGRPPWRPTSGRAQPEGAHQRKGGDPSQGACHPPAPTTRPSRVVPLKVLSPRGTLGLRLLSSPGAGGEVPQFLPCAWGSPSSTWLQVVPL